MLGETPLHAAASMGHLAVCRLIIENIDDKNPKSNTGFTPLHKATENGHLSVCQLIVENVDDKNPKCALGLTPLNLAEKYKYKKIQKLIEGGRTKKKLKSQEGCCYVGAALIIMLLAIYYNVK